jgi:chemotaxis response regulator CheB
MVKHKKALNHQQPVINRADQNRPLLNLGGKLPVVGIGASAGGLAAFEAFFSGMPADTEPGMAFLLVQHLRNEPLRDPAGAVVGLTCASLDVTGRQSVESPEESH